MNVMIIAEAGVNHNGDIEIAKSLIDVAADAKADIIILKRENAGVLRKYPELLKLRVENVKLQNSLKNEVRA